MATGRTRIGTVGFNYPDWLGNFYPQFCPPADFLRCYSSVFSAVELDSTFFRNPEAEIVTRWAKSTSSDFLFTARFPQSVTHEGDLSSRIDAAGSFLDVMKGLGEKMGPFLMQFPPGFGPECHMALKELLRQVPAGTKVAVEFRRSDWYTPTTFSLLKRRGVALCLTERLGLPRLNVRTADFVYIRLVGDRDQVTEDFSHVRLPRDKELDYWTRKIEGFAAEKVETYAFVSNHFSGHAPSTALQLLEHSERRRDAGS